MAKTVELLVANRSRNVPGKEHLYYRRGDVVAYKASPNSGWGILEDPLLSEQAKSKFWIITITDVPDDKLRQIKEDFFDHDMIPDIVSLQPNARVMRRWRKRYIDWGTIPSGSRQQLIDTGRLTISWAQTLLYARDYTA